MSVFAHTFEQRGNRAVLAALALMASALGCRERMTAAPRPSGLSPAWCYEQTDTPVVITGEDFFARVDTDFSQKSLSAVDTRFTASLGAFALRDVTLASNGMLNAVVPANVPVGAYALTVVDPSGRSGVLDSAFRVVAAGDAEAAVAGFHLEPIGSQEAGTAFTVTVTAVDPSGVAVTEFNGSATLSDRTGTARPTTLGMFASGRWMGTVEVGVAIGADALTVRGPSGQTGVSNDFPVARRPASALVFATGAQTLTAGSCSQPVTLRLLDDLGAERLADSAVAIALEPSTPSGFALYADAACGTPLSSPAISQGASSTTVYFRGTRATEVVLFASAANFPVVTQLERVRPATPASLVFTSPAQILNAGVCSQRATVAIVDAFGNRSPVAEAAAATIVAEPPAGFVVAGDPACTAVSDTVALGAGDEQLSFYFSGTVATRERLSVRIAGLTDGTQDEVIIPEGFATQLVFVTAPQQVSAGACSGAVSVQTQDSHGNVVQNPGAVQVALGAVPGAGFGLFTDPTCTSAATSIVIGAQRSTENFYFTGSLAGPVSIAATATGLMPASQVETIVPGAPTRVLISSPPQTLRAGVCSAPVVFELQDSFGNLAPATLTLTVTLTASPATGFAFSAPSACSSPITTVSVSPGATGGSFSFSGLVAGSVLVTVSAAGLTQDTQTEVLQPGPPSQLVFTSAAQDVPAGACSGATTLELRDTGGNPSPSLTDLAIGLAAAPATLSFFSDAACSKPVSSVTLGAGAASASFFFESASAGQVVVTASTGGTFPDAQQTEGFRAGPPASIAFLTGPHTVVSGQCSGALTVEAHDGSGNPAAPPADVAVTLSAPVASGVTFYSNAACASPQGHVPLTAGSPRASFHFKATTAGVVTLTASTTAWGDATQNETVTPLPADHVVFVTPARSATVGACSSALTLESRDASGNPSPVGATAVISLSSAPSSGFRFFADPGCSTAIGSVSLAAGASAATFYFAGTVPNSVSVTATPSGLASASQTELVLPAASPTQLTFTTTAQSVTAGDCSGAVALETRDSYGNPQAVVSATAVSLGALPAGGVAFFSDSKCNSPIAGVTVATGASTAAFYFSGTAAGLVSLTASAAGFNAAQQSETIVPAVPDRLVFTSAAQHVVANGCSLVVTLESRDPFGNPSAPAGQKHVSLNASPATGTTFFSGPACGSPTASGTLAAGATTVSFVFSATAAGALTIDASVGGWTGASQLETIDPAAPDRLAFTTSPLTVAAGSCSGAVVVGTRDPFGNTAPVAAATTVNLGASPSAGFQFFSGPGCTTAVTSVAIAPGASSASVYLRSTAAATVTATASATGMTSATQSETITAAPADRLLFTTAARSVSAGACSPLLTVQSRDSFGNASPVSATTAVTLGAVPATGFTFFVDSSCTTAGSPSLTSGASTASFYFAGTASGAVAVSASVAGWTAATQTETVVAQAASTLVWDPIASPEPLSTPSAVRVVAQDAYGNVATTFTGTAALSITPAGTVQCVTSCTNSNTTGAFAAGVWSGSLTFGTPAGTGRTLVATSGAVSGTSNAFDVSGYAARSPPFARFTRTPVAAALNQTITFDASSSTDYQTATANLQVSWDFSGVAATSPPAAPWTAWTTTKTATSSYATAGMYSPRLAVRDADSDIGYATLPLEVIAAANICVVTTSSTADDGAASCTGSKGADGQLSLMEAIRLAGSMPGHQVITFSGPMTITTPVNWAFDISDVDIISGPGVILNGLTLSVPNGGSARLSGLEVFGQTYAMVVRNGGTLVVTDAYLHDMVGISLEAGAAGELTRTRLVGCTMACISQSDTGMSPLTVRYSTFTDSAHPGVFMMAGNGATPVVNAYGNVFARMAIGILSWAAAPLSIRNNTFHGNTVGVRFTSGSAEDVRNNVFTSNSTSASCGPASFAFLDHQVLYGNTADGCLTTGTNTLTQDPLYQFLTGDDFRLQLGSPARDTASSLGIDLNDAAPGLYFGAGPDRGGRETW